MSVFNQQCPVVVLSYLRRVEKMCRGDFTFLSLCFLLCGLMSFSLLWHFHCCVTKVCIILQRKNTLMNPTLQYKNNTFSILFQLLTSSADVQVQICLLKTLETHQQWELEEDVNVNFSLYYNISTKYYNDT